MSPTKCLPVIVFFALLVISSAFTTTPSRANIRSNNNRNVAVSLSPTDIPELSSILMAKYDAKSLGLDALRKTLKPVSKICNPDLQARVISDGSHALMDFPGLWNKQPSKLQMRYAQVVGRLMILGIGFLPDHGFSPEEVAVQLFLLGVSMKPVIRSIKLYRCIASSRCIDECELELHDLETSLP